ncbi:MAG: CBS domain-containing protein [Gemmatimonadota bacterium]
MANFQVPAAEYMTSPLISLRATSFIDYAHREMQKSQVSALPVVNEDDRLVGVISRTDVLKAGRREAGSSRDARLLAFPAKPVSDFMTPDPVVVEAETPLAEAARLMLEHRIHRVFVEEEGTAVGIVTTRDLMRAIGEKRVKEPLSTYMSSPLFTIRASEPVSLATERLEKARVTGLVVLDGEWPVGVFTQSEAMESRDVARDTAVEDVMNPAILVLDARTPLHRAAAQAGTMNARRVVVIDGNRPAGIVTGLDFARVVK